jgi:zinc protease
LSDERAIQKLNLSAKKRTAKVEHLGAHPFGSALSISRYRLGNGLSILVLPDHSAPIVSYHTWFKVGSRHEQPGKTGQAHLLEHLMFIETKNLAEGEFDRRLEAEGGENNAATWVDWTYYYENVPASAFQVAVDLESDRIENLVLSKDRVASEKEVVESERRDRVEDDVDGAVSEALYALAFGRQHPYGWPTIGWMRDIEAFSPEDCRRFYRAHYAPDTATIIVAGDIEPLDVVGSIQRAYGSLAPGKRTAPLPVRVPKLRGTKTRTMRWPTPTEKLAVGWIAPPFAHRDHAAMSVLDQILVGGRSSRLYVDLVREREIATEVRMSLAPFQATSLLDAWVSMREGHGANEALTVLDAHLARLAREPVTEAELDKVKNRLELGFLGSLETVPGKAETIGFSETVVGDPSHAFVRLAEYRSVTADDVQRLARGLVAAGRVMIRVLPESSAKKARG